MKETVQLLQLKSIPKRVIEVYKGNYPHLLLKEIFDQPGSILKSGETSRGLLSRLAEIIRTTDHLYITGSGTSHFAASLARYLFPMFAGINTENVIPSEMKFLKRSLDSKSTVIAISQSGESEDVLEAVDIAKGRGSRVITIVNEENSSLARQTNFCINLNCGSELSMVSTKSFSAQIAILYKIVDKICGGGILPDIDEASNAAIKILQNQKPIKKIAKILKNTESIYVLGRSIHYPLAIEGAQKFKELAQIHAEGIAAGELEHKPLKLMKQPFVIIINPEDPAYEDNIECAADARKRGAKVIGISNKPNNLYDYYIPIPTIYETLYPLIDIIPIQLLAYYTALERGHDPDNPDDIVKTLNKNSWTYKVTQSKTNKNKIDDIDIDIARELLIQNYDESSKNTIEKTLTEQFGLSNESLKKRISKIQKIGIEKVLNINVVDEKILDLSWKSITNKIQPQIS